MRRDMRFTVLHGPDLAAKARSLAEFLGPGPLTDMGVELLRVEQIPFPIASAALAEEAWSGGSMTTVGLALLLPEREYGLMVRVAPALRRKGIGRELVERCLGFAAGWRRPPVVWRGTDSAHRFWATFGERVRYL